ncbi:MAG: DNA-directed DNA polymerase [Nitrososphaerales archaeon]
MGSAVGWILDVYVEDDEASIWLRTADNKIIKLKDRYQPSLYILPKTIDDGGRICSMLQKQYAAAEINWEKRYTTLKDRKRRNVLHIVLDKPSTYRRIVNSLKASDQVEELFNTDLLHIQQYLFTKLRVEPTSKVQVTFDEHSNLLSANKIDDDKEIQPPPFTSIYFEIHTTSSTSGPTRDRICSIKLRSTGEVIEGDEPEIIQKFSELIRCKDPDFLICPRCDDFTFPYLFTRCKALGLNPQLGRECVDIKTIVKPLPYWLRGRVALDYNQFGYTFDDWGIAGLVERARFSFLPPGLASRWTSNRVNDSRCCYELINRGYVIPKQSHFEYVRPMKELIVRDKGGIIIPPKIGVVHENVAELDYESQYPNIIVKECISYETVSPKGVSRREDALLPYIAQRYLNRRLYFKRLKKSFQEGSSEWLWCEQRQSALKLILVTLYGTSGCCWNRFGNVLAFEEINRKSREVMVKTVEVAQSKGFEIIYADCDSIFVKKPGALREDYELLAEEIKMQIGLPIALDHHYKFLLFLPLKSDPSKYMEAQKRHFGLLYDGRIVARGIELRRHDTPKFIKEFQTKLIKALFNCKNADEVRTVGYSKALQVVSESVEGLMKGKVSFEDLVVSKTLRKTISKYTNLFPHVSAATQLAGRGRNLKPGEIVGFIYTDADHPNPLCRVAAYEHTEYKINPDPEKYRKMILDAAETILSTLSTTR